MKTFKQTVSLILISLCFLNYTSTPVVTAAGSYLDVPTLQPQSDNTISNTRTTSDTSATSSVSSKSVAKSQTAPLNATNASRSTSVESDTPINLPNPASQAVLLQSTALSPAERTLSYALDSYNLTVTGQMPADTSISVTELDPMSDAIDSNILTLCPNASVDILTALNIELSSTGDIYNPVEHNATCTIDITGNFDPTVITAYELNPVTTQLTLLPSTVLENGISFAFDKSSNYILTTTQYYAEDAGLYAMLTSKDGALTLENYLTDEAVITSSKAVAAEYFGTQEDNIALFADFGISVTDYTSMPATFTIGGIFDSSYVPDEQDNLTLFNIDTAGVLNVIPYKYLDGTITFTANTDGHFFLAQDKSAPLTYTELETTASGYTIKATGNMPEEAELSVTRVYNTDQLEEVIGDEDYSIYVAFDIEILVNGEVWQPVNDGETVTITATNIEIPEGEELKVYRVEDQALESINVPEEAVVELNATETADGDIEVETEHFTTYTFGGVNYDSIETGTWLGMTYETYDTDSDGTAETLVLSGTQTTPLIDI